MNISLGEHLLPFLKSEVFEIIPNFYLPITHVHFGQKSKQVLIHHGRKFVIKPTQMQNPYKIN